jgi:hypothetical protein
VQRGDCTDVGLAPCRPFVLQGPNLPWLGSAGWKIGRWTRCTCLKLTWIRSGGGWVRSGRQSVTTNLPGSPPSRRELAGDAGHGARRRPRLASLEIPRCLRRMEPHRLLTGRRSGRKIRDAVSAQLAGDASFRGIATRDPGLALGMRCVIGAGNPQREPEIAGNCPGTPVSLPRCHGRTRRS